MNVSSRVVPLLLFAGALFMTGCGPDPKERIALLEETNQSITEDLLSARDDADLARQERDMARHDLAALQTENGSLREQLAARPEPTPEPADGWTSIPGGAMIALEGNVLFRSGKADIRLGGKKTLDGIARTIRQDYAEKDVLVYGHTDDTPIRKSGWKDNYELSAQRALSVVRYMQSQGIDGSRLVAAGCGEHRPLAPNNTKTNRDRNRRVEIFVLDAPVRTASR